MEGTRIKRENIEVFLDINLGRLAKNYLQKSPDPKGGKDIIYRKRHDKSNILPVSQQKMGLVRQVIKKYGLEEQYRITIEGC